MSAPIPAEKPARAVQEWISVYDRLPDVGVEVLLYRPDAAKSNDPIYTLRERHARTLTGPYGFACVAVPTHWMPLPAPPIAEPVVGAGK